MVADVTGVRVRVCVRVSVQACVCALGVEVGVCSSGHER